MAKHVKSKSATAKKIKEVAKASPAKPLEKDRRANFVRLANIRTQNAVKAIQLIGNLSNVADYDFNETDVTQILEAIKSELSATESRFKIARQKTSRKPVLLAA